MKIFCKNSIENDSSLLKLMKFKLQNIAFNGVSARSTRRDDKLEPLREEFESEIGVYQMEMLQICA